MYNKLLASCLLVIAVLGQTIAQQHEKCASQTVIDHYDALYPGYADALNQNILNAKAHAKQQQRNNLGAFKAGTFQDTVYRIPVVVHIIYTNANENLGDSVVHSQIEVLNQAYRRTGADTSLTRPEFLPYAADAGIEFYLADTDPQGQPTTGITRTASSGPTGFFFGPSPLGSEDEKKTANGGKDPWPTDRYLNIWVCNLAGGLGVLGYAYPPIGNLAHWPPGQVPNDTSVQGVVIYYKVFGSNNPQGVNDPSYKDVATGMTTVHEVGHYLGLRHVWGDGGCSEDDFVDDTPPAASQSQQGCSYVKNTCTTSCWAFNDLPDNIENYMDYSIDSCLNMFSTGQAQLMRSMLQLYRPRLGTRVVGDIKQPNVTSTAGLTSVVVPTDSVTLYEGYSYFVNTDGQLIFINEGDTLQTSNGQVIVGSCEEIVLTAGDYLVGPSGDTLVFNPEDTITRYTAGVSVTPKFIEDTTLIGLNELELSKLQVYPNPTKGQFMVYNGTSQPVKTVKVYNLVGLLITEVELNDATDKVNIDLAAENSGIYIVKVELGNTTVTKKLVKH